MDKIFSEYIEATEKMESINSSEMGYYYSLKKLIQEFSKKYLGKNIIVAQQRSRSFGRPDFTVLDGDDDSIGIIECKRPNINLIKEERHKRKGKQIKTYRKESNNFIFTNFYDFTLYNGKTQKISIRDNNKKIKNTAEKDMKQILTEFLSKTKDKYKNANFVIQGRELTKKQIKTLKSNKDIKIIREGWTLNIKVYDPKITPIITEYNKKDNIING